MADELGVSLDKSMSDIYDGIYSGDEGDDTPAPVARDAPPVVTDEPETPAAEKVPTPGRDAHGRFARATPDDAAEAAPEAETATIAPEPEVTPTAEALKAPATWTAAAQAKFATLDPVVQQEIVKREADAARGIQKYAASAKFGDSVQSVIAPYAAMIQAEGGTPEAAVAELLRSAYILRQGQPHLKAQFIRETCQQFGIPLDAVVGPQPEAPSDPVVAELQRRVEAAEQALQQDRSMRQQSEMVGYQGQIAAFGAEKGADGQLLHPHLEVVRGPMAAMLTSGQALNLSDAYDRAVWAVPEIRAQLIEQDRQAAVAKARREAEAARRASGPNVRQVGAHAADKKTVGTIDDTLSETYDRVMGS